MTVAKSKLKKLNKGWSTTRKSVGNDTSGFEVIPSGTYIVDNLHVEVGESQTNKLMVKRNVTIVEGEFENKKIFDNMMLEGGERSLEFVMKWLNFMGYPDLDDMENLPTILDEINALNEIYEVRNRSKDGFSDLNFIKIIEQDVSEKPVVNTKEEVDPSNDDVPFDGADKGKINLDDMGLEALLKQAETIGFKELGTTSRKMKQMELDDIRDLIEPHLTPSPEVETNTPVNFDVMSRNDLDVLANEIGLDKLGTTKRKYTRLDDDSVRDLLENYSKEDATHESTGTVKTAVLSEAEKQKKIDALRNFLASFGVECTEEDLYDDLVKKYKKNDYPRKELSEDEIALLEELGLSKQIKD